MNTSYEQIIDINNIASLEGKENIAEIIQLGEQENLRSASEDTKKVLLLAIDIQNDFMEGIGSLSVPGSKDDVKNLTRWIYQNVGELTQIMCSLDTHSVSQIFHPYWWINQGGHHPEPFTFITYSDVQNNIWNPVNGDRERTIEYLEKLETTGKAQLCIWPYHCLEGTYGADLEGEFTKMIYFHAAARKSRPIFIHKGQNPYSEMYGIIKAEYDRDNYINTEILDAMAQFDEIYLAGEASSHCVLASARQILEHYTDYPEITSRITLLEDCTSPIPGFEHATIKAFEDLKTQYGIQVVKSTEFK